MRKHVQKNPSWYKKLTPKINQLLDEVERHRAEASAKWERVVYSGGDPIACTKGCAACCNMSVGTWFSEGMVLARRLLKHQQREVVHLIEERARLHWNHVDKYGYLEGDAYDVESAGREWFRQKVPCVFLAEEGTCTIYKNRPLTCRGHFVVGDGRSCSDPEAVDRVPDPTELYKFMIDLDKWFLERITDQVLVIEPMPLPCAVVCGLELVVRGKMPSNLRISEIEEKEGETNDVKE